jgi:hypothetical protein
MCPIIHLKWCNNNKYKFHFFDNKQKWIDIFNKVKEYIDINDKRPSACDINKQAKSYGKWITQQSENFINKIHIMKDADIYNIWHNFITNKNYNKYFIDNKIIWRNKLNEIKEYIEKHNKRPSLYKSDKNTKILARWITQQLINYKNKKHTMKDLEIYEEFKLFISDPKYNKYF